MAPGGATLRSAKKPVLQERRPQDLNGENAK